MCICFIGCFEIPHINEDHLQHKDTIFQNNTVEGCYTVCQKKNIGCKETESVYFALMVMLQTILMWVSLKKLNFYILTKIYCNKILTPRIKWNQ